MASWNTADNAFQQRVAEQERSWRGILEVVAMEGFSFKTAATPLMSADAAYRNRRIQTPATPSFIKSRSGSLDPPGAQFALQ